jgi:hypothetical protein
LMPLEFPPDDVIYPQLAEGNLMVAGIALVGSCDGEFPSDVDGLRELVQWAREKVANGMEDLSLEILLSDEEQRLQPDHEKNAKPGASVKRVSWNSWQCTRPVDTGRQKFARTGCSFLTASELSVRAHRIAPVRCSVDGSAEPDLATYSGISGRSRQSSGFHSSGHASDTQGVRARGRR